MLLGSRATLDAGGYEILLILSRCLRIVLVDVGDTLKHGFRFQRFFGESLRCSNNYYLTTIDLGRILL